jgi:hypothetical protein
VISTMWKLIIVWATLGMCSKPLPSRATCDRGWYVDGIRPSGRYDCRRAPIGDDVRLPSGLVEDRSTQPSGEIDGAILCTGGTQPIVVDERTVECRR